MSEPAGARGQEVDPRLGPRFEEALGYALRVHGGQARKGGRVPYLSHLLAVAALVLDDGGGEDEAIAALLHDAPEDQGGRARLDDIGRRFGGRVAEIVAGCTETTATPKPPWAERKREFVERVRGLTDPGVLRVSLADKVANARSMVDDHRRHGDALFDRFNAPEDSQRRYYGALVEAFAAAPASPALVEGLRAAVATLFPPHPDDVRD